MLGRNHRFGGGKLLNPIWDSGDRQGNGVQTSPLPLFQTCAGISLFQPYLGCRRQSDEAQTSLLPSVEKTLPPSHSLGVLEKL